ncbi:MAG: family 78 glycoside hydrolase catalytic domain, partial [Kiritimatiellae bacterium]|nr:family 78 glycoside hydrolase catalytic domain [Kiritimatiellia bacterium]
MKMFAMVVAVECLAASAICGEPRGLVVERLENPCGVDSPAPRFSWKMTAEKGEKDVVQSAYRVLVASSKEKLAADSGDLWDSGKVEGAQSIDVAYAGKPLASSRRYWWKVRTWNGAGAESAWSAPAEWVTGILQPDGWKAKWIGPDASTRPDADMAGARWITAKPNARGDVELRFDFDFAGAKPGEYVELLHAASARHEIDVNGKEFHRHFGHVDRWNHLRFRDMTPWLKPGKNTMTVRVKKGAKGVPQAFICTLRFPDGRRIVTDGTHGDDLGGLRDTPYGKELVTREEIASPAFEKKFTVSRPVASAILHVTGVGFYEASLNGRKIGDKVLDPSPTAYDRHVLYSTYDLGGALKQGVNTLKVLVGHGWYDVRSIAVWNFDVAPWRDFPRMIAQLEIAYADGSRETVVSDGSWRQVESPVGYDCIREGEVIGAHNPAQPDFAAREIRAAEVPAPKGALVAENCPGAKVMRTIAPKAIHAFPDGTYVVEFPENFAGWVRMDVRGQKKGDVLAIRYDERVNRDFSPASVRRIDCHFRYTASQAVCAAGAKFQTDRFVSSGADVERYEPRFTYNGFQYVVLSGLRAAPRKEDITGCVVHTDFPAIGSFECSDETFNTLMKMGDRAYRSNFADGYPTDCPHREKNGWTGDASIASELAQYCYENTAAYEKWLRDIMDTQLANGDICCIVPTSGWGFRWGNGPAWDSALPVVAWNLWCYRGDRRALDAVYPALKRYVDYTSTLAKGNLVRHGLGDWIPVERRHMPSTELTSSCYYRQAAAILSRIAS